MPNQAMLDAYRRDLLDLLSRSDSNVSQLRSEALEPAGGEASGSLSNLPTHMADLGTHLAEGDMTLTLLNKEEQIIAEINSALARMENGTYGNCESCGKQIPRPRLQALPYARNCMECALKLGK
jgi:RNA polymerase-binding protein DksA